MTTRPTGLVLATVVAAGLAPALAGAAEAAKKVDAWAYDFILEVRSEPTSSAREEGYVLKGEAIQVVERKGEWSRVVAYRGLLVGWVEDKRVSYLKPARAFSDDKVQTRDYGELVSPLYPGSEAVAKGKKAMPPHQGPYRGSKYCGSCHTDGNPGVPGGGRPYAVWRDSAHAQAFATLKSPKAKAVGRRYGIATPHRDGRCLKCHVTGYGAAGEEAAAIDPSEGVGCEACHGPGNTAFGSGSPYDVKSIVKRAVICTQCHNELSPTHNGFDLTSFSANISHWGHAAERSRLSAHARQKAVQRQATAPEEKPPAPQAVAAARQTAHTAVEVVVEARAAEVKVAQAEATKRKPEAGAGDLILHDGGAGAVVFPHQRHQTEFDLQCATCHHQGGVSKCRNCHTPNFSVPRKEAFHDAGPNSCRGCHRARKSQGWDGPLTCTGCHKS